MARLWLGRIAILVAAPTAAVVFAVLAMFGGAMLFWALGYVGLLERQTSLHPAVSVVTLLVFVVAAVVLFHFGLLSEDEELWLGQNELTYLASRANQKRLARKAESLSSCGVEVTEEGMRRAASIDRSAIADVRLEDRGGGERLAVCLADVCVHFGETLEDSDRRWLLELLRRWKGTGEW